MMVIYILAIPEYIFFYSLLVQIQKKTEGEREEETEQSLQIVNVFNTVRVCAEVTIRKLGVQVSCHVTKPTEIHRSSFCSSGTTGKHKGIQGPKCGPSRRLHRQWD